jgi:molecular chaperone GrpE
MADPTQRPDADEPTSRPEADPKRPRPETPGAQPRNRPEAPAPRENAPSPETPVQADGGTAEPAKEDPRVSELSNLVIHLKADFDNYKKRASKEMASSARIGELETVRKFLPAFANLERALQAARGGETAGDAGGTALVDGIRQIHEQFQTILRGLGVERVEAKGQPFDPSLHEAVAAAPNPEVPPGTVTDEFEPGYRADGRALVHAKVRVSTAE